MVNFSSQGVNTLIIMHGSKLKSKQITQANEYDNIPREVPTRIAVGVASPSAQGQETT